MYCKIRQLSKSTPLPTQANYGHNYNNLQLHSIQPLTVCSSKCDHNKMFWQGLIH